MNNLLTRAQLGEAVYQQIKADIETNNEKIAIENLERCIFVLEHIKDKNLIKIVNIF